MKLFELFWEKLNKAKKIDKDVRMTPAQFENMLSQAYDAGYTDGHSAGTKARMDLEKLTNKNKSPFDFMGGW